jgi:hypothetical protein
LTTRAIVFKLNSRLPDNIPAEYYIIARYFLNRILIKRIRYRTPIGGFLEEIENTNWKPNRFRSEYLGVEHMHIITQGINLTILTLR